MIIAITGASGVGKTTAMQYLAKSLLPERELKIFHFDDMGLPNWDEVEDVKQWQEEATLDWVDRLVQVARAEQVHVLFEGSTEIKFFIQGFEKNGYADYKILLFDCREETMRERLIQRGQPELYHPDMVGWLHYLRREAVVYGVDIVDTGEMGIEEIGQRIVRELG